MPSPRGKKSAAKKPTVKRSEPAKSAKPVKSAAASAAGSGMPKRLEVTYKGRVQGVGFRFNVEQAALGCGVTGWVRNEHNGDVQMVAEGAESSLFRLLDAVRMSPVGRHIVREQIRWDLFRSEFRDFRIEYHC